MSEADRISLLTVFQTLKTKTARLLEPIVQAEGLTPLQASVLLQLVQKDAAVGDISEVTCMGQANASSLCKKLEQGGYLNALPAELRGDLMRGLQAATQMLDYLFDQTKGDQKSC